MSERKKDGMVDEVVEDLMDDPDAPAKGNADTPPQTVKNEPETDRRPA